MYGQHLYKLQQFHPDFCQKGMNGNEILCVQKSKLEKTEIYDDSH
jgi:hypothetical protein